MIFEVLRYRLKPGCEASFAKTMQDLSIPLHAEAGIFVVFHGAIEGDLLGYILVRRFLDPGTMEHQLNQFYASPAWRDGPRQSIVDAIDQSERTLVGSKERQDEPEPE